MLSSQRVSSESVLPLQPATMEFSPADLEQLTALVKQFHQQLERKSRDDVSTKMLVAQIMLAFLGSFAGFLYFNPAEACAGGACDDEWLAKAIPEAIVRQYIYFLSGFVGFASTNCTFSYRAPKEYMDMLNGLNSRLVKVLATGGVLGFALLQGLQISLTAAGTGSSAVNMVMTVTGSIPGAVYGGVGLVKGLPHLVVAAKTALTHLYYDCRTESLSEEAEQELALSAFYLRQRQHFNALVRANWRALFAKLDTLNITGDENPMAFLLSQAAAPAAESWWRKSSRQFLQTALGGALTASFTAPMLYNSYELVNARTETPIASGVSVGFLCATTIYSHTFLTTKGVGIAAEAALDKLSGEPIQSLVYQLRPWSTTALLAASTAFAALSYAVVDNVFNKMWAPATTESHWNGSPQAVGRGFARTGIDLYHVMGPMDVGTQILFRRMLFHGTPKEKFLARLQLMVTYLTEEMSQQEFVRFISTESEPATRDLLQVQAWDDFVGELQRDGGVTEANRERVTALGMEKHWGSLRKLLAPACDKIAVQGSAVSSSAGHWQSKQYLLSPKAREQGSDAPELKLDSPRVGK